MSQDFILVCLRNALTSWKAMLACTAITALLAILLGSVLPNKYTAVMTVGPKTSSLLNSTGFGLGKVGGALGTLAALQGQTGDTTYDRYRAMLTSQDLANALLKDRSAVGKIFELAWDPNTQTWKHPTGFLFELTELAKSLIGMKPWHAPATADMTKFLSQRVATELDRSNGFTTLSFTSKDPYFAQSFLLEVHSIADSLLRKSLLSTAQSRIDYLSAQLQVTDLADTRSSLMDLLLAESKTKMAARADTNFAVEVIDQPSLPTIASSPSRLTLLVVGILLGAIGSILYFGLRLGRILGEIFRKRCG